MLEIDTVADLAKHVGQKVGVSDWLVIDQPLIDRFADVTLDRNWYHVDIERAAREMPGGKTIAHGLLLLSLIPGLTQQIVKVRRYGRVLNYGFNKVRFMTPVPVDSRVRIHSSVASATRVDKGLLIGRENVMELEGVEKPAMAAEMVVFVGD